MTCPRCKGLLVKDEFNYCFEWLTGIRCLNCGYIKLDKEQKIIKHTYREDTKQVDELELYKIRNRIRNRSRLRSSTLRTSTY